MPRALLMIADIGGYTRFMTVHRINLAHAQYVVGQLLEAVIDAAPRSFTLAKLEGDAVFFYATLPETGGRELDGLETIANSIREGFLRRRHQLEANRMCTCDSCVQASTLTLKFVSHVGEIAFQRVKRFREVAGVDVIYVHRLLKNSVPLAEYVLMSEPLLQGLREEVRARATALTEELEGLGASRCYYLDLARNEESNVPTGSLLTRLLGWLAMTWRSLPYFLGLRKPCEGFRNLGGIGASPLVRSTPPDAGSSEAR